MTETSYTAWDDKLYQWPPPDGWYEAGDGKWWPEGYGPGPVDAPGDAAEAIVDGDGQVGDRQVGDRDASVDAGPGTGEGSGADGDGLIDGLTDRASGAGPGAAAGLGAAAGTGLSNASDVLAGLTGGGEAAADGPSDGADPLGSLSDRANDALAGGGSAEQDRFGSTADAASDAGSDLAGGLSDAGSDLAGGLSDGADAFSGSRPGSIGDAVPDSIGDVVPDAVTDANPDRLTEAAPDFGAFGAPGDDVGAALAETMSARSDELTDPASSGISGVGALAGDQPADAAGEASNPAADAAAEASEFFTADIPASDLGSPAGSQPSDLGSLTDPQPSDPGLLGDRPPTDLDALPPPSFDPPGGGPLSAPAPAADDLADLADPPLGFAPPGADVDPGGAAGSAPLFPEPGSTPSPDPSAMPGPSGFGDPQPSPSIGGFEFPPDETLAPPGTGAGEVGGAAAAALGLPMAGDPATDLGRPDETMVAPLSSSLDASQNPAETGQFPPSSADAPSWDAPLGGQFGVPPSQAEVPGSMPWGQGGVPGGPPVAGGLDQAVLQDDRSGSSGTLLKVGLGVAALVVLGIVAFVLLGGSGDDDGGDATGPGSLAEPHARTTPVEIFYPTADAEQRFVIEVLEPLRDASGQADGTPPAEGQRFAVTRVRVANQTAADASVSNLRFNAVTASGDVLDRESNACSTTEPALDFAAVLGQAGVAEGVVCWIVPAEDYDGLLLGIESTQVSGRIHIDLQ